MPTSAVHRLHLRQHGCPRNRNIASNAAQSREPDQRRFARFLHAVGSDERAFRRGVHLLRHGIVRAFRTPASDPDPRPSFFTTTTLCGVFKVPSLRNVAITSPYFHDGNFSALHQVVEWYVTRDINNSTGNIPPRYRQVRTVIRISRSAPSTSMPTAHRISTSTTICRSTSTRTSTSWKSPHGPPTFSGGQAPTLTALEPTRS